MFCYTPEYSSYNSFFYGGTGELFSGKDLIDSGKYEEMRTKYDTLWVHHNLTIIGLEKMGSGYKVEISQDGNIVNELIFENNRPKVKYHDDKKMIFCMYIEESTLYAYFSVNYGEGKAKFMVK